MNKTKPTTKDTLDDSAPGIGSWNGWYVAVVIFNILFIALITYIFSNI